MGPCLLICVSQWKSSGGRRINMAKYTYDDYLREFQERQAATLACPEGTGVLEEVNGEKILRPFTFVEWEKYVRDISALQRANIASITTLQKRMGALMAFDDLFESEVASLREVYKAAEETRESENTFLKIMYSLALKKS